MPQRGRTAHAVPLKPFIFVGGKIVDGGAKGATLAHFLRTTLSPNHPIGLYSHDVIAKGGVTVITGTTRRVFLTVEQGTGPPL